MLKLISRLAVEKIDVVYKDYQRGKKEVKSFKAPNIDNISINPIKIEEYEGFIEIYADFYLTDFGHTYSALDLKIPVIEKNYPDFVKLVHAFTACVTKNIESIGTDVKFVSPGRGFPWGDRYNPNVPMHKQAYYIINVDDINAIDNSVDDMDIYVLYDNTLTIYGHDVVHCFPPDLEGFEYSYRPNEAEENTVVDRMQIELTDGRKLLDIKYPEQ